MHKFIYPIIQEEKRLPFYLTGIGISDPEHNVMREKGMASYQILITTDGSGWLEVGNKRILQQKGSIFYLAPGVPHHYYPQDEHWVTKWLVFQGKGLENIMNSLHFDQWMEGSKMNLDALEVIFMRIFNVASHALFSAQKCSPLVYEYILETEKIFHNREKEVTNGNNIVEKALYYMNDNYAKEITLEQLAAQTDVSMQHFCRVFKEQEGMRPMDYLARVRMEKAKSMLLNTTLTIGEIGQNVGYDNLSYFGMVFRKYEGISPGKYRKVQESLIV